ncbi:MAG: hypothetical protein AAB927_04250 [Patescibacteria group bacterium]
MKTENTVSSNALNTLRALKADKIVFVGTVNDKQCLFDAAVDELIKVAEIKADEMPAQVAEALGLEIVTRIQANHDAVKGLMKAWIQAKRAKDPVYQAKQAERLLKAETRQAAKAERDAAKAAKNAAKADKTKAKAEKK